MMRDVEPGSVLRGLRAWRPRRAPINYAVRRIDRGQPVGSATPARRWWVIAWTPAFHDGRGPYVSIGVGWFALYRGY